MTSNYCRGSKGHELNQRVHTYLYILSTKTNISPLKVAGKMIFCSSIDGICYFPAGYLYCKPWVCSNFWGFDPQKAFNFHRRQKGLEDVKACWPALEALNGFDARNVSGVKTAPPRFLWGQHLKLGGGFIFFLNKFTPILGEMIQFDYFSKKQNPSF